MDVVFVPREVTRDVTLIHVAVVDAVGEFGPECKCGVLAIAVVRLGKSPEEKALIQFADGVANVVQLGDHRVLNFAESDDHANDEQGGYEHEFGGDDKAGFITIELG
jgi:hypothetical protein